MTDLRTYVNLYEEIYEEIQKLPSNVSGLIVFDIDDTILKVNPEMMHIYKTLPDGNIVSLTTEEFAKDPDAKDPKKLSMFDYKDFNDPVKVYNSIISGTPIIKNLKILDDYINAGYDFSFLTARGCEDVVKQALSEFLRYRDENGVLKKLGDIFKKSISHAVNDTNYKSYPGKTDGEKKAAVLKHLCDMYDKVIFVDDDKKNLKAAKNLNLKNLKIVKAQK